MKKGSKKEDNSKKVVIDLTSKKTGIITFVCIAILAIVVSFLVADILTSFSVISDDLFFTVGGLLIPFLFIILGMSFWIFIGICMYENAMNKK